MKKTGIFVLIALAMGVFATSFTTKESVHEKHESHIIWTGKKVTGQHVGTIDFSSVDMEYDKGGILTAASFVVDMTSIKCTDLDEESAPKLEGHLSSPDFFNVEEHKISTFTADKITHHGNGKYEVSGMMTIKGIAERQTFMAEIVKKDKKYHAKALMTIDRTKYDIKYGSGSFFDGLGDKMISDEFTLDIMIQSH